MSILLIRAFLVILGGICLAEKIRYFSTERPVVAYYNSKYINYLNVTSHRYGRRDPLYYVGIHIDTIYPVHNNWSVVFIFYESMNNGYEKRLLEMRFKFCDLIHNDMLFGSAMRQGKLNQPCPYPPGEYHMYNMTMPMKHIPRYFPISRGRIFCNVTSSDNNDVVVHGSIGLELKYANIVRKN